MRSAINLFSSNIPAVHLFRPYSASTSPNTATPPLPQQPDQVESKSKKLRWKKIAFSVLVAALATFAVLASGAWVPIGKAPAGDRLKRIQASTQWHDDTFQNPQSEWSDTWGMTFGALDQSPHTHPAAPIVVDPIDPARFQNSPASGLRVTWMGHSTLLVEIDGIRILTDPVWGERTSPVTWVGPKRWYKALIKLEDLPKIDAVVISHDHYDHLDYPTILRMKDWDTTFVVPLGVGAHLEYWGVAPRKIKEVDWWDEINIDSLKIVSIPARHESGRHVTDHNKTLWSGFAFINDQHRVLFSGDTGLFPGMQEIGDRLGPFDLTMIEIGAYGQAWPDWHLGPEQAIRAHQLLRGKVLLPIHWGLFDLAFHGWTEPIERAQLAAKKAKVQLLTPRPGQSYDPGQRNRFDHWWPDRPWQTAQENPIRATETDAIIASR